MSSSLESLGLQGYQSRRRRRQVHIQQHCDYRAELCDVEDALMEMYEAIQLTPPVDDLEPYLKDVHRLQERGSNLTRLNLIHRKRSHTVV